MTQIPDTDTIDTECESVHGNCSKCRYKEWCDENPEDLERLLNDLDEW